MGHPRPRSPARPARPHRHLRASSPCTPTCAPPPPPQAHYRRPHPHLQWPHHQETPTPLPPASSPPRSTKPTPPTPPSHEKNASSRPKPLSAAARRSDRAQGVACPELVEGPPHWLLLLFVLPQQPYNPPKLRHLDRSIATRCAVERPPHWLWLLFVLPQPPPQNFVISTEARSAQWRDPDPLLPFACSPPHPHPKTPSSRPKRSAVETPAATFAVCLFSPAPPPQKTPSSRPERSAVERPTLVLFLSLFVLPQPPPKPRHLDRSARKQRRAGRPAFLCPHRDPLLSPPINSPSADYYHLHWSDHHPQLQSTQAASTSRVRPRWLQKAASDPATRLQL